MLVIPTAHENLARWSVHASLGISFVIQSSHKTGKTVYEIIQKFMQDPPLISNADPVTTQPRY
jgi:hypothetical protein